MTRQEIVQALRCCAKGLGHDDACENCKVGEIQDRREYIEFAAANVIERLTAENAALLEYVKKSARCEQCASYRPQCDAVLCVFCGEDCPCQKCKRGSEWKWKGLEDAL